MPFPRSRLLAAALLCAAHCAVRADEPAPVDLSNLTELSLEQLLDVKVTGASKFSQRASDAPASISVITAEEFHRFGWRTLADALRSVRGLYVTYDRAYSYVGIRGFQRVGDFNSRILLLIDGYRVNDNIFDQAFLGGEFPVDPDLIERVEIIRGPSSSVYGGNALFGVINVITKSPVAVGAPEIGGSYGSYASREGRIAYGSKADNGASLLLSASRYKSDGPTLAFPGEPSSGGRPVADTDWEDRYRVFGKFEYDGLHVSVYNMDRQKGITGGLYGTIVDPRNITQDRQAAIDVAYTRMLGAVETTAHVAYRDYRYVGDFYYDPATLTLDKTDGKWWTAELKGVTQTGPHKLVFGAEYQENPRQNQTNFDTQPFQLFLDNRHTSDSTGIFAQDDFALTGKLTLSSGLRYDATESANEFSPRVGLIYHVTEPTVVKLLYGEAFRPPNVYERFYSLPGEQVGNPDLKPERIQSVEAILETWVVESTRLSFVAFHYRIRNLIDTGVDPVTGLAQFQNLSEARTNGGSAEFEFTSARGIRLRASYAFQDARDASGNKLSNLPTHLAKANASAPIGWGLQLGVESQYTSRRETALSNIPGYAVVNATISTLRPWHGWDLSASVYNLADRTYYDPADLGPGRDLMQQDGRTWQLKGIYRF